jgi:hypothetical protein
MRTKIAIICLALCLLAVVLVSIIHPPCLTPTGTPRLSSQDLYIKLKWSDELITDLANDDKLPQEDIAHLSLLWLWASSYFLKDDLVNTDRLLREMGNYYFDVIEPQLIKVDIPWTKGTGGNQTVIRFVTNETGE